MRAHRILWVKRVGDHLFHLFFRLHSSRPKPVSLFRAGGVLPKKMEKRFVQYLFDQVNANDPNRLFFRSYIWRLAAQLELEFDPEVCKQTLISDKEAQGRFGDIARCAAVPQWEDGEFYLNFTDEEIGIVLDDVIAAVTDFSPVTESRFAHFIRQNHDGLGECFEAIKRLVLLQDSPAPENIKKTRHIFDLVTQKDLPFVRYKVSWLNQDPSVADELGTQILRNLTHQSDDNRDDALHAIHWWWETFRTFDLPEPAPRFRQTLLSTLTMGSTLHLLDALVTTRLIYGYQTSDERSVWRPDIVRSVELIEQECDSNKTPRRFEPEWIPNIRIKLKKLREVLNDT